MEPARLRRHENRASYEWDAVSALLHETYMAHVGYADRDGDPVSMPMIALPMDGCVYLHGHPSSALMELVRGAEARAAAPVKVCISATKVDGLVLSSAPNGHTFNYRSAIVHGDCSLVRDAEAKRTIMEHVTNHIVPDRWRQVNPVASFQVSLVCVIRVTVRKLSLKVRKGIPGIQPRDAAADGPDNAVPPWTGVVPLWEHLGEPVPSGLSDEAVVPKALLAYIDGRNTASEAYARSVAR